MTVRRRTRGGFNLKRNHVIPPDVFRKKSDREYNCHITSNRKLSPTFKTVCKIFCSKFQHLQRKKKSESKQKTTAREETKNLKDDVEDKDDYVCAIYNSHEKKQCNQPCDQSEISSLWEDLFSLRHLRIRDISIQCYLLTQQNVPNLPTTLNGTPWTSFKYEILRLGTYNNYPTSATKSTLVLAGDGFVYIGTGSDDKVICYSCYVTKNSWIESEVVTEVHKMISPNCSMVTGIGSDNIPIMAGPETFEDILSDIRILENDKGYSLTELDKPNIEMDAAPLASQEHAVRNDDAKRNKFPVNQENGQSLQSSNILGNQQENGNSVNAQLHPGGSTHTYFASLEQAYVTLPPSAEKPVAPLACQSLVCDASTIVTQSNPPQALITTETKHEITHPEHRQAPSSQSRSTVTSSGNVEVNTPISASNAPHTNTTSTQVATGGSNKPNSQQSSTGKNKDGKGPTYSELGIITERPKRTEYALKLERIKTFSKWPMSHHIKADDLADAGFYFAGYGDCARCFFCGGGLRNWEDEDDVWVEHARWFPKCAFIRQLMGQNFVDAVQELNKTKDKISFRMVTNTMKDLSSAFLLDSRNNPLKRDPAVRAMIENGYPEKQVLDIASLIKSQDNINMSADVLLTKLIEETKDNRLFGSGQSKQLENTTLAEDLESIRKIKERNNQLRQQTICKICMDKDVEVVFLPCGHLVSCAECAGALKDCPVCRKQVKGTVRAFIG